MGASFRCACLSRVSDEFPHSLQYLPSAVPHQDWPSVLRNHRERSLDFRDICDEG